MKTYTTVQGDMWDVIAFGQLGSASYMDRLINANQQHAGTYIFPAGVVLNLPDIPNKAPGKQPPWKKVSG